MLAVGYNSGNRIGNNHYHYHIMAPLFESTEARENI